MQVIVDLPAISPAVDTRSGVVSVIDTDLSLCPSVGMVQCKSEELLNT